MSLETALALASRLRFTETVNSMLFAGSAGSFHIVTLPEFGGCKTHGATYEEAARMGLEALESLIETCQADGEPLPEPAKFGSPVSVG